MTSSAPLTLDEAIGLHRQGQFESAISVYQSLIDRGTQASDAHDLMGLAYQSMGQLHAALQALNQAIHLHRHPKYLSDRAAIFLDLDKVDESLADAKAAIKLEPQHLDAHINLISALRRQGQQVRAIRHAREQLKRNANASALWNNLGACLLDQGQIDEALAAFEQSLQLDASSLVATENVARLLWLGVASDRAAQTSQTAFERGSADPQVLWPWLRQLIAAQSVQADESALQTHIWCRLMEQGRDAVLQAWLEGADERNALFAQASTLQRAGFKQKALSLLTRASQLRPDDTDIWNNLGVAHFSLEDHRGALAAFQRCCELRPDFPMAWRNVGVCHFMLIEPEQAREAFEKSYALDGSSLATQLYLFGQCLQCCEWSRYEAMRESVIQSGLSDEAVDDLSASLSYLAAVHRASDMATISVKVAHSLSGRVDTALQVLGMPFARKNRLRVGYFSYDFRTHPVGYLTEEVYALHDRARFEVLALSYGPDDQSPYRQAVMQGVDRFIDLQGQTAAQMVRTLRDLDLDILVDLTGNTQGSKSEVVMHRVAPIQCHWLGYVWSMGHPSYDYIVGDTFSTPPELEHGYIEKPARLPHTLQVSSRRLRAAESTLTRASQGLPQDAFVLCNFGSFSKMQPELFGVWLDILKALPNAVLWLARTHRTPSQAFDRLRRIAREKGISDEQIIFSEPLGREQHLLRYQLADLALDTFPQGSGTTAIEALWMGCPMLSMAGAGETLAVRMAGGILQAVGLSELVVNDLGAYRDLAIDLARAPQRVRDMRAHLLRDQTALPLFNTPQQVRYLEQAFEHMASRAESGLPPQGFTVQP